MSKFLTQKPLILASASKSRINLLASLGIDFDAIPASCDEEAIKQEFNKESMLLLANTLASYKALEVSKRYPEQMVIGADQLCIIGNSYLDKPLNHSHAVAQLRLLSGKTHQLISAYCLAKAGQIIKQDHDVATLTMRELSDATIDSYLTLDKPYQSCGSYHFEGLAKWLFTNVHGSDSTILGLPLIPLIQTLLEHQVIKLS